MLKVLLVDDEPFILQGLSVIIDWNSEGFEIAGKVSNAFEALELLQKETVDLVIADIKMPKMTGLELLEKVREEKLSDAYFVILSGYNDFSYVRTALKNECLDYMLKPVGQEELLEVLHKVRELHEIDSKKRLDSSMMEREVFAKNMISICFGKYRPDNVEYVKRYLGQGMGFRYISVELDVGSEEIKLLTDEEKRQLQRELYQKCLLLFPGKEYLCLFDASIREESYDVGVIYSENISGPKGMSEQEYLECLQGELKESVEFPIIIIVGSRVETIEEISDSCKSVLMAHSFRGIDLGENQNWSLADKLVDKQTIDALIRAVEVNDKEAIVQGHDVIFEELKRGELDERMINMVVNYLLFQLIHLASEQDGNVNQQEIFQFISENAFAQGSIEGSDEGLKRLLLDYGEYLAQLKGNQAKGVLGKVENDLRENFRENLTLKDLSRKYYVNAAYLGQIFKKQYGESFKDYLNHIRIEKAVELLLHTDMRIYEIADAVGYKDMDYFINKFIAIKGCTPAKFRKQIK